MTSDIDKIKQVLDNRFSLIRGDDGSYIFFHQLRRFDTNTAAPVKIPMDEILRQESIKQVNKVIERYVNSVSVDLWPIQKKVALG